MLFQLVPGGFLDLINYIEQLELKLEKNIGIRNMQEKLENVIFNFCFKSGLILKLFWMHAGWIIYAFCSTSFG